MSPIEERILEMLANVSHVLGGPVKYGDIIVQSTSNLEEE